MILLLGLSFLADDTLRLCTALSLRFVVVVCLPVAKMDMITSKFNLNPDTCQSKKLYLIFKYSRNLITYQQQLRCLMELGSETLHQKAEWCLLLVI